MHLTLRIRTAPPGTLPLGSERTFDTAGGVIGRAEGCDWSLPDPDSVLSRRHCEILFSNGAFQLADTSSNGVFVNGSVEPVGPGGQYRIADGDLIQLGQYEVEAVIVPPARPEPEPGADPGGAPLTYPGSPFAEPRSSSASFDSPFLSDGGRPPPADELWNLSEDAAQADDPFGLGGSSSDSWLPSGPEAPRPATPFASGMGEEEEWAGPVRDDHAPLLHQAFPAPAPDANPIPENWDSDFADFGQAPPAEEAAPGPLTDPLVGAVPHDRPADPPIAPDPLLGRAAEAALGGGQSDTTPSAEGDRTPMQSMRPSASGDTAVAAFLAGAGLDPNSFATEPPEETMRRAGELFREMVAGLRDLLQSRASLKNEFRVDRTVIGGANNNPLKFSVDPDDATLALLGRRRGYMPGAQAVEDGILDLKTHQLAVIRAMQLTVSQVIGEFDPERVKARAAGGEAGLGRFISSGKARNWEAYEEHYGQMARDMEAAVRTVFEQTFARAYEETIRELKGSSTRES